MNAAATKATGWKTQDLASFIAQSERGIDPFALIGSDWMLVGAGTGDDWNAMTASWGGLGHLWNKNVAFCFVRPSRHTFKYMEKAPKFTLSFFGKEGKSILNHFGAHSGRDGDKAAAAGATPVVFEDGSVSFAEARLALVCRKLYAQEIEPTCFVDPSLRANYPGGDYHTMYIGEIESVRTRV